MKGSPVTGGPPTGQHEVENHNEPGTTATTYATMLWIPVYWEVKDVWIETLSNIKEDAGILRYRLYDQSMLYDLNDTNDPNDPDDAESFTWYQYRLEFEIDDG